MILRRLYAGADLARRRVRPAQSRCTPTCSGCRSASTTETRPASCSAARPRTSSAVRFFLAYGLMFLTQHIIDVIAVSVLLVWTSPQLALLAFAMAPLIIWVAARYSRSRTRPDATPSRRSPTSRPRPRRTSSASGWSRRSARRTPRPAPLPGPQRGRLRPPTRGDPAEAPVPAGARVRADARDGGGAARRRDPGDRRRASRSAASSSFNLYLAMLIVPLRMLGMWIGQAQRASPSGERIFEVLDVEPEIVDAARADAAARRAPARSASRASRSATRRPGRCCGASTSTSTRARRSR